MHLVTNLALLENNQFGKGYLMDRQSNPNGVIARLINTNSLNIVSQPIVNMVNGAIFGHEALVRGPKDSLYHSPDALLRIAKSENSLVEFEIACVVRALEYWSEKGNGERIFINVSASALTHSYRGESINAIATSIDYFGIAPKNIVFEITEHEHILDVPDFISIASTIHSAGIRFALDDFGDGRSSLRMWAELAPDIVKIDKYFTKNIANNAAKVKTIRALMQMAENFDCSLVAEGIETEQNLHVLRDMGIHLGQGYFLGMPQADPLQEVAKDTQALFSARRISIVPIQTTEPQKISSRESLIIHVPAITRQTTNAELLKIFLQDATRHAVAVLQDNRPVAIIGRTDFLGHSAKPFFGELFGKKSCMRYANTAPRTVELEQDVQDLIGILTSDDQRYRTEGFIYTKNGEYVGIGLGEHLVQLVTETRVDAAKHANPLTSLPGNIPIAGHINSLLQLKRNFVVAYADLANFKPFNDHYGYWQGDEMIKLVASTMLRYLDSTLDFIGHIGGDDFLFVFQSEDWHIRLKNGIAEFNLAAMKLYDETAIQAGGIEGEDRDGTKRFFPMTTLYAGVVHVGDSAYKSASEVSEAAATARHLAKKGGVNIHVQETSARLSKTNS